MAAEGTLVAVGLGFENFKDTKITPKSLREPLVTLTGVTFLSGFVCLPLGVGAAIGTCLGGTVGYIAHGFEHEEGLLKVRHSHSRIEQAIDEQH